jgi:DNA-binding transcriptional LysR family regulator
VVHNQKEWVVLNLRQLEIFRAVLGAGSFTGAGVRLHMSQPAVTKSIRRMEDEVGFSLFSRVKGRIVATPEARSLQSEVDKVFHTVRMVEKYAHDLKDAHSGVLSLACTPTMSCGFLTQAIARFRLERPKVRVWLQITTTRETMELAANGQVDLGLIYAPGEHEGLDVVPLFESEVVCVLPPGHRLAACSDVHASDLKADTIITNVRNQHLHELIDFAFRGADLDRSLMIGTNSTITACAMVRAGCGIAVVEPLGIKELFPDLALRPLSPQVRLTPRVVQAKDKMASRVSARFLEILKPCAVESLKHPPLPAADKVPA